METTKVTETDSMAPTTVQSITSVVKTSETAKKGKVTIIYAMSERIDLDNLDCFVCKFHKKSYELRCLNPHRRCHFALSFYLDLI